jgi:archaeal type IV pilus assembly protein PilA
MMTHMQSIIKNESAISPVVGVMLMLVVTIIVAAVVSGFAGGLVAGQKATPSLSMDTKIVNTGTWLGSGFYATVTGVSAPIPTSDLKIVTSWKATSRLTGSQITGGATIIPTQNNVNFSMNGQGGTSLGGGIVNGTRYGVAPFGVGPGVGLNGTQSKGYPLDSNPTDPYANDNHADQEFGNYSLMVGTNLYATPSGSASMGNFGSNGASSDIGGYGVTGVTYYNYTQSAQTWTCTITSSNPGNCPVATDSESQYYTNATQTTPYQFGQTDPMQAVLGQGWENLMPGNVVNVKVIHVPSGKVIFQKDIAVTEG